MHIEIWQGKGGNWHWHFKARNGRIVTDAEAFPTKANAMRAAKAAVRAVLRPIITGEPRTWVHGATKSGRDTLEWR